MVVLSDCALCDASCLTRVGLKWTLPQDGSRSCKVIAMAPCTSSSTEEGCSRWHNSALVASSPSATQNRPEFKSPEFVVEVVRAKVARLENTAMVEDSSGPKMEAPKDALKKAQKAATEHPIDVLNKQCQKFIDQSDDAQRRRAKEVALRVCSSNKSETHWPQHCAVP